MTDGFQWRDREQVWVIWMLMRRAELLSSLVEWTSPCRLFCSQWNTPPVCRATEAWRFTMKIRPGRMWRPAHNVTHMAGRWWEGMGCIGPVGSPAPKVSPVSHSSRVTVAPIDQSINRLHRQFNGPSTIIKANEIVISNVCVQYLYLYLILCKYLCLIVSQSKSYMWCDAFDLISESWMLLLRLYINI